MSLQGKALFLQQVKAVERLATPLDLPSQCAHGIICGLTHCNRSHFNVCYYSITTNPMYKCTRGTHCLQEHPTLISTLTYGEFKKNHWRCKNGDEFYFTDPIYHKDPQLTERHFKHIEGYTYASHYGERSPTPERYVARSPSPLRDKRSSKRSPSPKRSSHSKDKRSSKRSPSPKRSSHSKDKRLPSPLRDTTLKNTTPKNTTPKDKPKDKPTIIRQIASDIDTQIAQLQAQIDTLTQQKQRVLSM